MLGAIQPRAVRLYGIEEQSPLGTIFHRVCNYRYWISRFVRHLTPTLARHDVDARSFDVPRSGSGGILCVRANCYHDMAVWVFPPILLHDALICNILAHVEHHPGMVSQGSRNRNQQNSQRDTHTQNCLLHLHVCCWNHTPHHFRSSCLFDGARLKLHQSPI